MSKRRHAVRALSTFVLLVGVAVLGQLPFGEPSTDAALRLALRTVEGKIEVCRDRSPAELEALASHMRTPRECSERTLHYRLTVSVDGRQVLDETLAPRGLRGDRPLVADRLVPLPPGRAHLALDFRAVLPEELSAEEQASFAGLPAYQLDREVELTAGRILLVTLDDTRQELELVGNP